MFAPAFCATLRISTVGTIPQRIFFLAVRRKLPNSHAHEYCLTKLGLPRWFPCVLQKRGVAVALVPRPMRQLTFPAIILPKLTCQQGRLRLRQKRLQLFEPHLNQPISTAGFGGWVEEQAPSVLAPIPPVRGANISNF